MDEGKVNSSLSKGCIQWTRHDWETPEPSIVGYGCATITDSLMYELIYYRSLILYR